MRALIVCVSLAALASGVPLAQTPSLETPASKSAAGVRTNIPYVDAKGIIEALQEERLPADLRGKTTQERELIWSGWVSRRDQAIRSRIDQGDEDSIFNFLLFGTSFTKQPRVTDVLDVVRDARTAEIVQRRLDDMVAGLVSPRGNERLQFVRDVIDRRAIDLATEAGKRQARLHLVDIIGRVARERDAYNRAAAVAKQLEDPIAKLAAHSTLYHDRGLSSDTAVFPGFAVEQTLQAIKASGILGDRAVRRAAIIGPGLDFTDKEEGYDFYPLQTIQPFAVADSLLRLKLATSNALQITTFDLSPRVNRHLELARRRAGAGGEYVLTLPRNQDERWRPELVSYWERMGDQIGKETAARSAPSAAGNVRVRSVRVRPSVMMSINSEDMNVVLQRLEQPEPQKRFDVIIATNVLVYYDVFEQSLALANLAAMLRPGGLLLSNDLLHELPTLPMNAVDFTNVGYTDAGDGDRVIWYQRQ